MGQLRQKKWIFGILHCLITRHSWRPWLKIFPYKRFLKETKWAIPSWKLHQFIQFLKQYVLKAQIRSRLFGEIHQFHYKSYPSKNKGLTKRQENTSNFLHDFATKNLWKVYLNIYIKIFYTHSSYQAASFTVAS